MLIIPTPDEARTYQDEIDANPELKPVLENIIERIRLAKGATWVDQSSIPSDLFPTVRRLLARRHWVIESGYNAEETYSYYSIDPCKCSCCAARNTTA